MTPDIVGFIPIKLSSGELLLKGQSVTCFTDKEEAAVNLVEQMPFLLETRLKELGANFTSADLFQPHVVVGIQILSAPNFRSHLSSALFFSSSEPKAHW